MMASEAHRSESGRKAYGAIMTTSGCLKKGIEPAFRSHTVIAPVPHPSVIRGVYANWLRPVYAKFTELCLAKIPSERDEGSILELGGSFGEDVRL
jgi:hypothetical protein